jgi:hypothetical protein
MSGRSSSRNRERKRPARFLDEEEVEDHDSLDQSSSSKSVLQRNKQRTQLKDPPRSSSDNSPPTRDTNLFNKQKEKDMVSKQKASKSVSEDDAKTEAQQQNKPRGAIESKSATKSKKSQVVKGKDSNPKKPPKKRKKTLEPPSSTSNGDVPPEISEDALGIVMKFLGPRELFRLAYCSKQLLAKITPEMVIRSAMISGGHAATTIKALQPLMANRSIYPPSALRLLRLINGRKCELCGLAKVSHARPNYGVFFCWPCTTERTRGWKTNWVRYDRNPRYGQILHMPIFQECKYGKQFYLWTKVFIAVGKSHEKAGPIVTFGDVERVAAMDEDVHVEPAILEHVPPPESYQEFLEAYEAVRMDAIHAEEFRRRQKLLASRKMADRKLTIAKEFIEDLKPLIADEMVRNVIFKYTIPKKKTSSKQPCLIMEMHQMRIVLGPYLLAPSKVKRYMLPKIAEEIKSCINHSFADLEMFDQLLT